MNIVEKKLENSSVELQIDVPVDKVNTEYTAVFAKIQKSAKIDGFRKGKAPITIIEQKYRQAADGEVAENLAKSALYDAITEKQLTPIAAPVYDFSSIAKDEVFSFKAIFEIPPTVELGKYKDIPAEERSCKITDQDVEDEVISIREKYADVTKKDESGVVEKGDMIKLKVKRLDQEEDPKQNEYRDYSVVAGKAKDEYSLDKHAFGLKMGDEKEVTIKYPKNYTMKELAGQKATYSIQVAEISSMKLPEYDDEFAKKLNYSSIIEMTEKTREHMEKYIGEKARGESKAIILRTIVESSKFDIPKTMIENEMNSIFKKTQQRIGIQNSEDTIDEFAAKFGLNTEEFKGKIEQEAIQSVKTSLTLSHIAKTEELQVDEDKYKEVIENIARSNNTSVEEIEKIIKQNNSRENIEYELLMDKAMDFIYENAKIKTLKPSSLDVFIQNEPK